MSKKLETRKEEIVKTTKVELGPYTIHEVENADGTKGWGLAVKSSSDRHNPALGKQISYGRSVKALKKKINGEKLNSQDIFCR